MIRAVLYRLAATLVVLAVAWVAFFAAGQGAAGMFTWWIEIEDPMERGMAYIAIAIAFHAVWASTFREAMIFTRNPPLAQRRPIRNQYQNWRNRRRQMSNQTQWKPQTQPPTQGTSQVESPDAPQAGPEVTADNEGGAGSKSQTANPKQPQTPESRCQRKHRGHASKT